MKRWIVAAVLTILTSGVWASASEAPPITPALLQKILKFVDINGSKENFSAPTAQNLGLSNDPSQILPVVVITTDDHTVYFCRSELNPEDYIIWSRVAGNVSSYMFSTHPDFKLIRALYLRAADFPRLEDVSSPQIQAIYKAALTALAKDIDRSPLP